MAAEKGSAPGRDASQERALIEQIDVSIARRPDEDQHVHTLELDLPLDCGDAA